MHVKQGAVALKSVKYDLNIDPDLLSKVNWYWTPYLHVVEGYLSRQIAGLNDAIDQLFNPLVLFLAIPYHERHCMPSPIHKALKECLRFMLQCVQHHFLDTQQLPLCKRGVFIASHEQGGYASPEAALDNPEPRLSPRGGLCQTQL